MRPIQYLNTVLTVIAVLLSLNLWAMWTQSGFSTVPSAQAQAGIPLPDPGVQRNEMNNQLRAINEKLAELNAQFKGGTARVRVESMPEK